MSWFTWTLIGVGVVAILLFIFCKKCRGYVLTGLAFLVFGIGLMIKRQAAYRDVTAKEKQRRKELKEMEKANTEAIKTKIKEEEAKTKDQVIEDFKRRFGNGG